MTDYYEVLGTRPTATADELQHAYWRLAKELHPDALVSASSTEREAAGQRMKQVNLAWAVLGDVHHRAVYDHRALDERAARGTRDSADDIDVDERDRLLGFLRARGISPAGSMMFTTRIRPIDVPRSTAIGWNALPLRDLLAHHVKDLDAFRQLPPTLVMSIRASAQPISDGDLGALEHLSALRRLDISETQITDAGLGHLLALDLRDLTLWDTAVTDKGMEVVGRLTGLVNLNIGQTAVTDAGIAHLHNLLDLRFLNLRSTAVTAQGLMELAALPALEMLATPRLGLIERHHLSRALSGVELT